MSGTSLPAKRALRSFPKIAGKTGTSDGKTGTSDGKTGTSDKGSRADDPLIRPAFFSPPARSKPRRPTQLRSGLS
jgi:hypothetical protein